MSLILGIDYGTKRIGTAISDETETIAQAFQVLEVKDENDGIKQLKEIIQKYNINFLVIGNPLGLESKPTQMSEKINLFSKKLAKESELDYKLWNETLTSEAAKENLKNYKHGYIDAEAARIMLQEYLDYKRYKL